MLRDIDDQNWEYAHRLFQCVAAASRPLLVEELAEFLAFDFSSGSTPTLLDDWRSEDPAHAILSTCSSLLAVVDVKGSPVIQFSHFSVKEYLTSERLAEAKDNISRFHVFMTPAHTIVAQACLGVLLHVNEDITEGGLKKLPLAEYAAEHWVGHARFEGVSLNIQDGMKRLFDPNSHHLAVWIWIHDLESPLHRYSRCCRPGSPSQARATVLHYAAFCGLCDIVEFLIVECLQDVNARGFDGDETVLGVASREGHSDVARVLLEHGADTELRDGYDWSPLDRVSQKGHEGVAGVLLEHGADVRALDRYGNTALHVASGIHSSGHPVVARLLLEHGADANAKNRYNRTPLHWAQNESVARVLLEYGAETNAQDVDNRTTLHLALKKRRAEVARVLLENGADANSRDSKNKTPLHLACRRGDVDVGRWLLQHGSDIHARDNKGRTPFQVASANQHHDVMQLLLEHGAEDYGAQ
jgi:ankyrin repeat protein